MKNKNIAILVHNLDIGGVQKALIEFSNKLSIDNYVTLYSIKENGILVESLSKNIRLVFIGGRTSLYSRVSNSRISDLTKIGEKLLKIMVKISKILKCEPILLRVFTKKITKEYDVAISYTGRPGVWDYIVNIRMSAAIKIVWIHNDPYRLGLHHINVYRYYHKFNLIFNVSYDCRDKLNLLDNRISEKNFVMYNLVNKEYIRQQAVLEKDLFDKNCFNIVTVTRLQKDSKRLDRIIEVSEKLVYNGIINFCWHVVGDGTYYEQLKTDITANKLDDYVKLYGFKKNPYPFIYQSDVFCLVSDYEGLPITLMEAKVLKKPIISTNVDSVKELINHEIDGLIVEKSSEDIYIGLKKMIEDKIFLGLLSNNASRFEEFSESNISYFYSIVGNLYEE